MLNIGKRKLAEGYSKRQIALELGISEGALRKRLKKVNIILISDAPTLPVRCIQFSLKLH